MHKETPTNHPRRRFCKHPLRYVMIALCIALFVVINMVIIFCFSAESKDESGERSTGVTTLVVSILYPDYNELGYYERLAVFEEAHGIVRKAAHFLEYTLLGFLTAGLMLFLRRFLYRKKIAYWQSWIYPSAFCLLYAISDEVHQIFSKRGPSVRDVCIDFAGAMFGICLIQFLVWLFGSVRNAVKERREGKENP